MPASYRMEVARMMGMPGAAHRIRKQVCLSLPGLPICMDYVNWFTEHKPFNPTYGIMCESIDDWKRSYGDDAFRAMVASMIAHGRPTIHWTFIHYIAGDDEVSDMQAAAAA